jgi:hypothetical protein
MMARRFSSRGICKDRVYTIKMAARTIDVSEATFRKWPKDGLRLVTDQRPYLIRGADLIEFLQKREAANKVTMARGQFFCMRCKAPRDPVDGSVSYQPTTDLTGRLSATCGVCGGKVGQFCSATKAVDFIASGDPPHSAGPQA